MLKKHRSCSTNPFSLRTISTRCRGTIRLSRLYMRSTGRAMYCGGSPTSLSRNSAFRRSLSSDATRIHDTLRAGSVYSESWAPRSRTPKSEQNAESPERWIGAAMRWQYRVRSRRWIDAGGPVWSGGLAPGAADAQRRRSGGSTAWWRTSATPCGRATAERWIDGAAADQRASCG
ncbi:hypothetical protein Zm00014a_039472 [Zea mays]|uniref:Uncharacterized protein n=1 Tax=Zea mays TaxID=4577 RepID=A0A317Y366_MAIZE|nr:hypothetical protein Zm00014a_039472 [Zea mays]